MDKLIEPYEPYFIKQLATGSRIICDPPVLDTDVDFLLLSYNGAVRAFEERLKVDGFVLGGSLGVSDDPLEEEFNKTQTGMFHSWKRPLEDKTELNLLVTLCPEYFDRFTNATNLARKLNLLKKEDRIALFQGVVCEDFPRFEESPKTKFKWDFGRNWELVRNVPQQNAIEVANELNVRLRGEVPVPMWNAVEIVEQIPNPIRRDWELVQEVQEELRVQQIVGLAQPGDVDGIPQLARELNQFVPDGVIHVNVAGN